MKLLQLLTSKAGKMALSPLQAVGLSAAVGIAGIAAWQMMGSSSEVNPDTVFSAADNDVVFVAGTPGVTGGYGANYGTGGSYGEEGGAVRSAIHTSMSADMRLMQQDQMRANMQAETPEVIQQEQSVQRYNMTGSSEGLGMGQNEAMLRGGAGQGNLSAIQEQIAALQAGVEQKQAEAAAIAAAAQGGGDVAAAAAAALGQSGAAGGKWGMASGMARASGSNLNSTPLQAGGSIGPDGRVRSAGVLGGAERGAERLGAGRAPMFEGGKDAVIGAGRSFGMDASTLAGLSKQSKEVAGNRDRSANEASRIFMGGERLSAGISLNGDSVTIGASSSADFNDDVSIGNLGGALGGVAEDITTYEDDRENLRLKIRSYVRNMNNCSHVPIFGNFCYIGAWKKRNDLRKEIHTFDSKWGTSSYEEAHTNGSYAEISRKVVDRAYEEIYKWSGPAKYAEKMGKLYWNDSKAFRDKEKPSDPGTQSQMSTTPHSGRRPNDGLEIGSGIRVGSGRH